MGENEPNPDVTLTAQIVLGLVILIITLLLTLPREQTSLLSIVKLATGILSLLVLIIALILAFCKLTTNNNGNAIQTLPEGNAASTDGVTNSSNHDNVQLIALNFNAV